MKWTHEGAQPTGQYAPPASNEYLMSLDIAPQRLKETNTSHLYGTRVREFSLDIDRKRK